MVREQRIHFQTVSRERCFVVFYGSLAKWGDIQGYRFSETGFLV
jgi:hypothetical protein